MLDVTKLGAELGQTVLHSDMPKIAHTTWNLLWPGHLVSEYSSQIWDIQTQAKCFKTIGGRLLGHIAPDFSCTCGIRVYKTLQGVTENDRRGQIYGTVELFGKVIEHALGYRTQHARVRSLTLTENAPYTVELTELLENLRQRYGGVQVDYDPNFWTNHPTKLMKESKLVAQTSANPEKSHPREWAEFKGLRRVQKLNEKKRALGVPQKVEVEEV
jgi:hypothetical protein